MNVFRNEVSEYERDESKGEEWRKLICLPLGAYTECGRGKGKQLVCVRCMVAKETLQLY